MGRLKRSMVYVFCFDTTVALDKGQGCVKRLSENQSCVGLAFEIYRVQGRSTLSQSFYSFPNHYYGP
jgi:hypothetical protein